MKAAKSKWPQCLLVCTIMFLFALLPGVSAAECDAITGSSSYVLFPMKVPHLGSPRVVPNPDYITQTEQERKFTPKEPYSPFDNFRVVMDVSGLAGDSARVANFRARLIATDEAGKEEIIWAGAMHREKINYTQQSDSGTFVADINGYPNGLGGEEIIDAIAKNRKIFIRVERLCPFYDITEHISKRYAPLPKNMQYKVVPNPDTQSSGWDPEEYPTSVIADEKVDIPMQGRLTNCAQIYGSGRNKIVSMRTTFSNYSRRNPDDYLSPYELLQISYDIRSKGFGTIEPFKKYNNSFSHFVDLKYHLNLSVLGRSRFISPESEKAYKESSYNVKKQSSCRDSSEYALFSNDNAVLERIAYATYENILVLPYPFLLENVIIPNLPPIRRIQTREYLTMPLIFIHETGHAFCYLNDEYLYSDFSNAFSAKLQLTNCVTDTKSYLYNGKMYGAANIQGCGYLQHTSPLDKAASVTRYYRPTKKSIMRSSFRENEMSIDFNVISCGYCLAKIKGGSAQQHWEECVKMNTLLR